MRTPFPCRSCAPQAQADHPVQLQFDFGEPGPGAARPARVIVDAGAHPCSVASNQVARPALTEEIAAEHRQMSLF
jgi:hypothetical protein